MTYLTNFFHYFFQAVPGNFKYALPLAIIGGLFILAAIVFTFIYNKRKKSDFAFKRLFKNLSKRFVLIGALLIVYVLIRYENIPYFSMRLWMYLIGALFIYLAYRYIKAYRTEYPKAKANFEMAHPGKKTENKYLPNKKR
jgi:tellurite resistance protein TehA-like permease